jgi:hypothetical protein
MATANSITTTYAGEHAGQYVAAALLTANTIAEGGVTVRANVKYKEVISKLSLNDVLKDATCDFSATSTITQTERILTPEEFQVNLQLCKKDFDSTWQSIEQGYSAFDELPKSYADFLIAHVSAKVAAKIETNLWSGVTANNGEFDGFETLMTSQADQPAAQEISGTTISAGNVIAQLRSAIDVVPTALIGDPNLRIFVNAKTAKFYVQALGGYTSNIGAAGIGDNGPMWYTNGDLSIDGVRLFVANGMSDDTAIITTVDNLYFGTGLLSDQNMVKVIDMADIDGSQNVRVVMRMTAGCQIANTEDVVTYGITNSAN